MNTTLSVLAPERREPQRARAGKDVGHFPVDQVFADSFKQRFFDAVGDRTRRQARAGQQFAAAKFSGNDAHGVSLGSGHPWSRRAFTFSQWRRMMSAASSATDRNCRGDDSRCGAGGTGVSRSPRAAG